MVKQVIVIRKDLNMRKGKMCAQAAHASLLAYLSAVDQPLLPEYQDAQSWLKENKQTKICVGVESEQELFDIYSQAQKASLVCSLVLDAAHTEFDQPTYTAVCLGPASAERIDPITGLLKLL
jgi:peptidyl-tRNA hydrolase, PTH2 family